MCPRSEREALEGVLQVMRVRLLGLPRLLGWLLAWREHVPRQKVCTETASGCPDHVATRIGPGSP